MTDNVVDFPSDNLPENMMQLAPSLHLFCSHDRIVIDMHTRTVQCAEIKCGKVLDPFNYLASNAQSIATAWNNYRETKRRADEVAGRVNLMLREEQRLRSMLKRLQDKTGAVLHVKDAK